MNKKSRINNVKKGKIKMLFFFLLVTSFMWLLTKFSNEFTATVVASLEYNNLPKDKVLLSSSTSEITFDHTSSGFEFLIYKLRQPVISIDINDFYDNKKQVTIVQNDLRKLINSSLKTAITVKNISIDTIHVKLDSVITKKLPVFPIVTIDYQNGYKATKQIELNPEYISISGPSKVLNKLNSISTKPITLKNIHTNITGELEIDKTLLSTVNISDTKVSYTIAVEEFTQKEISVPIQVENLPIGLSLKLIPEEIGIVFDVSISNFNLIRKHEFKVICDYLKRNEEQNFMIPKLTKFPSEVQNISLATQKIKYLVFK